MPNVESATDTGMAARTGGEGPRIVRAIAGMLVLLGVVLSRPVSADVTGPLIQANGVSVPGDFPRTAITVNKNPSPGYIFLENKDQGSGMYTMMLDNNGDAVWYRRGEGRDFKIQPDGTITWGTFTGMDKNFNPASVRTYSAANGYSTDAHELQVLANGGYLLIGGRDQTVDMGLYIAGGQPDAIVHETLVQEFTAAGELIFQWRPWDHCDFNDMDPLFGDLRSASIDLIHTNSISVDDDGNLVVSHRHLNEATKIDRRTGAIIWRLGGTHNQFKFANDPQNGFHGQHDVRALGNGHYTVFDDGAMVSRVVEYELDVNAMTATLVWEFRDTPDRYSWFMGSAQRLPTGNTLINWGLAGYPKAVEVDANGVKQFEMSVFPGTNLYRSFRFVWDGVVAAPYLIVEPEVDGIALVFNKFGDRNVAYYRIYAGTTPQPTQVLDVSEATLKRVTGLTSGQRYYFRVTAVSTTGHESAFSNEESVIVPTVENQVRNGDFAHDRENWSLEVGGSASASWAAAGQAAHIDIAKGGTSFSDVRLSQAGMQLLRGQTYTFGFRAWADKSRVIQVRLERSGTPNTDYARIGYVYVTPTNKDFRYTMQMQDPTDAHVRLVFYVGGSDVDVHIDEASLKWNGNG